MLKKDFILDGNRRIIGSVTTGFNDTSRRVRDESKPNHWTHQRTFQHCPRRARQLGFINSSDPGLLIRKK